MSTPLKLEQRGRFGLVRVAIDLGFTNHAGEASHTSGFASEKLCSSPRRDQEAGCDRVVGLAKTRTLPELTAAERNGWISVPTRCGFVQGPRDRRVGNLDLLTVLESPPFRVDPRHECDALRSPTEAVPKILC